MSEPFHVEAHIHSLNGKLDTIPLIDYKNSNHILGSPYTAIYNPFAGYVVDDIYDHIKDINQ